MNFTSFFVVVNYAIKFLHVLNIREIQKKFIKNPVRTLRRISLCIETHINFVSSSQNSPKMNWFYLLLIRITIFLCKFYYHTNQDQVHWAGCFCFRQSEITNFSYGFFTHTAVMSNLQWKKWKSHMKKCKFLSSLWTKLCDKVKKCAML